MRDDQLKTLAKELVSITNRSEWADEFKKSAIKKSTEKLTLLERHSLYRQLYSSANRENWDRKWSEFFQDFESPDIRDLRKLLREESATPEAVEESIRKMAGSNKHWSPDVYTSLTGVILHNPTLLTEAGKRGLTCLMLATRTITSSDDSWLNQNNAAPYSLLNHSIDWVLDLAMEKNDAGIVAALFPVQEQSHRFYSFIPHCLAYTQKTRSEAYLTAARPVIGEYLLQHPKFVEAMKGPWGLEGLPYIPEDKLPEISLALNEGWGNHYRPEKLENPHHLKFIEVVKSSENAQFILEKIVSAAQGSKSAKPSLCLIEKLVEKGAVVNKGIENKLLAIMNNAEHPEREVARQTLIDNDLLPNPMVDMMLERANFISRNLQEGKGDLWEAKKRLANGLARGKPEKAHDELVQVYERLMSLELPEAKHHANEDRKALENAHAGLKLAGLRETASNSVQKL